MFWWIIILVIGAVALSLLIGGGINTAFVKVLAIFIIGYVVIIAFKKLWDTFNGKK